MFLVLFFFQETSVADPFHFEMHPDPAPNPIKNRENINFCYTFFFYKKYNSPNYDLFCYLWGNYICH